MAHKSNIPDSVKELAKEAVLATLDNEKVKSIIVRIREEISLLDNAKALDLIKVTKVGRVVSQVSRNKAVNAETGVLAKELLTLFEQITESEKKSTVPSKSSLSGPKSKPEAALTIPCPLTDSAFRNTSRSRLAVAMVDASDIFELKEDLGTIAASIEDCVYKVYLEESEKKMHAAPVLYEQAKEKYMTNIRSRESNLKRSYELSRNVITGEITAAAFAVMKTEAMLTAQEQLAKNEILDKANEEKMMKKNNVGTPTSEYACKKCQSRNCRFTMAQTRSSDEPMTVWVFCCACGFRWRCSA